jgi:vitamin B12 transporter
MSKRTKILITLPLSLALAGPAVTQQAQQDTVPRYEVDAIEVTVTRAAARAADVPQRIDVITATDLQRTGAYELADVLKKNAAIDVVQYSGLLSGVSIRGFRPQFSGINQRTLILVDGRPAGTTNLAIMPMADIERIEVLKGPAAALYGTNAMGGVINVITRRSQDRPRGSVSLGYGTWETREGRLSIGGPLVDRLDFDLGISYFERAADYRVGQGNLFRGWLGDGTLTRGGTASDDPTPGDGQVRDFSQYGTESASLRLGYQLFDGWRVDARGDRFRAERVQNPGDILAVGYDPRTLKDVERNSGDVSLSGALGVHAPMLRFFETEERSQTYNAAEAAAGQPQFIDFDGRARTHGLQLQNAMQLGAHALTFGADLTTARAQSERFSAPGTALAPYNPDSERESRAAFAHGSFALFGDRLVATAGGRFDHIDFRVDGTTLSDGAVVTPNEEAFSVFSPSIGLQARLAHGLRLNATRGHAFVAPDAFQVAGYSEARAGRRVALTRGNADLDPENSITHDLGFALVRRDLGLDAEVTYFHTDVRDRITTQRTVPSTPQVTPAGDTIASITTYLNANETEIRGLEWRVGYDLGPRLQREFVLRFFANATHILRAEDVAGETIAPIHNVADLTVGYGVEYDDRRRFSTRLSGRYVGERHDRDWSDWSNPGDVVYPRFMVLDLSTDYRLAGRYRVGLLIDNLTDENYFEKRGFNLPGRSLRLRVGMDW